VSDFCKQCANTLFPPGYDRDLADLSTEEDTKAERFMHVLCEGCGPTLVDHDGICVSADCLHKHGEEVR
jgi:hypothetical protein